VAVTNSCPTCGQRVRFPEKLLGKNTRCRQCGEVFRLVLPKAAPLPGGMVTSPGEAPGPETCDAPADPLNVASDPVEADRPTQIGRFQVRALLGAGAFGMVYRAFDPNLGREVALKVPHPDRLNPLATERFLREARTAARLRHPHLVPVFDVGSAGDQHYIASAFIEGHTLAEILAKGPQEPCRAAEIIGQLAEGLAYAHRSGVVHRDVKPTNIMLDEQGRPYLMDFGVAFCRDAGEKLTRQGSLVGTPAYMAPEQARGAGAEPLPASDQYSLGVVLYEALCGQRPFEGPPETVLLQIVHAEPPSPRRLRPDLPRDLETICLKALAKQPEERYPSCREFARDLRRWLEDQPILARRLRPSERLRRWYRRQPALAWMVSGVVFCLLLTAAVATASALRSAAVVQHEQEFRHSAEQSTAAEMQARQAAEQAERDQVAARNQLEEQKQRTEQALVQSQKARQKTLELQKELVAKRNALQQILTEKQQVQEEARRRAAEAAQTKQAADQVEKAAAERAQQNEESKIGAAGFRVWDHRESSPVTALAFSSDGKHLAAGMMADGLVEILDPVTGQSQGWFRHRVEGVWCLAFSPDNRHLAVAQEGAPIAVLDLAQMIPPPALWNRDTPSKPVFAIPGAIAAAERKRPCFCLAFSPDGRWLASPGVFQDITTRQQSNQAREVVFWDAATGRQVRSLRTNLLLVTGVAFDPTGKRLAVMGKDEVIVWDLARDQEMLSLPPAEQGPVLSVSFSPDGNQLALASGTHVKVWDLTSGKIRTLKGHRRIVHGVAFSPGGRYVASASADGRVIVWDLEDGGRIFHTLAGHARKAFCVVFAPDGRRIASGGGDMAVRLWDPLFGPRPGPRDKP
jgi:hypothetical protein